MSTLEEALAICPQPELHNNGEFVCYLCCADGRVMFDHTDNCIIFFCPDHMRIAIKNNRVVEAQTLGRRQ